MGGSAGQFSLSHCVRIDRYERVWVCDRENRRIQIEDLEGNFLTQWQDLAKPDTIYFDPHEDVVYIAELERQISPLQEAFVKEQAIQCGYCVVGMLMAGSALLNQNPSPSLADIHAALQRNLYRCGVYPRIVRAVQRAARQIPGRPVYEVIAPKEPSASGPGSSPRPLPQSLQRHPDLDDWMRCQDDGTVDFFTGKVELGQGIVTALSQVVAEELDMHMDQVRIHTADTARSPDEGATAGSLSLEVSGGALRQAAAEVHHHVLLLEPRNGTCRGKI